MRFLDRLLRRIPPNHGTVTFLKDDRIVLGTPKDATAQDRYYAVLAIQEWSERPERKALVFPWPVDVRDER